jgi:HAMP domain-containing protein
MKIHHRLRTKLIVVFSIVTLIPALITGIFAIQVSSKSLRKHALATQTEQAKTLGHGITSFLSVVRGDLLFLSQSMPMKDYLSLRAAIALSAKSKTNTQRMPPGSNQSALQTFHNILEKKQQNLEQEFLALSRNRRIYYQIRYLDEKGQEVVRVDFDGLRTRVIPEEALQDKSGRYYFKKTSRLSGKQIFVSPLDLNREKGKIEVPYKPVIRYAINVYDDNRKKAGIVILNIDASQFLKQLDKVRLVDSEGYFLNHPNPEKSWGGKNDLNTGYDLKHEYPQLLNKIMGQHGIISNRDLTLSYLRVSIPASPEFWTLIIQRDTHDILKSVTAFRTTFTFILIIAILIALIFALFFSAKITRPIEYLTRIADAISKGELVDNRVEVKDKGEIGQLAHAFERMRVSMIKSFERLRRHSRV